MPDTTLKISRLRFSILLFMVHYLHLRMRKYDAWRGEVRRQSGTAGNCERWDSNPGFLAQNPNS